MSNRIYTLDEIAGIIAPIAARYGVDRIFIFALMLAEKPTKTVTLIYVSKQSLSKGFLPLADCMPILKRRLAKSLI